MVKGASGTVLQLDSLLGGGGGAALRYRVKSVQDDYLTCHTWDGTTEETLTSIYIAKPPHLRHTLSTQTIDGAAVTFTGYTIAADYTCTRTVTAADAEAQIEMVIPTWQTGTLSDSEIWAVEPNSGTGVTATISSVPIAVALMDLNLDARAWCQIE